MMTTKAGTTRRGSHGTETEQQGRTAIADLLAQAGIKVQVTLSESQISSVTTSWGVSWDEPMIARDLLQNFFDANRAALDQVKTRAWAGGVQLSAPTAFELDRLFYLGSEKTDDDVGQYGEGFKAAAICLLRDHGVQPVVLSGAHGVMLSVAPQAVGETALRPVVYQYFEVTPAVTGTVLLLPTRSPKLVKAVSQGMNDFLHPGNPALGDKITETDELALYHSRDGDGHLFYRNLRRCTVAGYPLVWVVHSPIATVEKRIGNDRDRNAFGEDVREHYLRGFLKLAKRKYWRGWDTACSVILQVGEPHWERGHPILAELARQLADGNGDRVRRDLATRFKGSHFARERHANDEPALRFEIDRLEQSWISEGRIALPGYFVDLGADTARRELIVRAGVALEASRKSACRQPTVAERASLEVLGSLLHDYAPDIAGAFANRRCSYTVGSDESLLGELRRDRGYKSTEVYLDESVFVADLSHAAATFLHEHAHIFGWDGSRGFTDALTELLETVIREHGQLSSFEVSWDQAVQKVRRERAARASVKPVPDSMHGWLSSLDAGALRALLEAVPPAALRAARKRVEKIE